MQEVSELLKALVPLAWPLLISVFLWRLWPVIVRVIDSRAFTLKFAGIEVTTQEATNQIRAQLQDLKDQVLELKKSAGTGTGVPATPSAENLPNTILWIDDKPTNNALEISQLVERGYKVITAVSTDAAMASWSGPHFAGHAAVGFRH